MIGYLNGLLSAPLRIVLFATGILFFVPGFAFDAGGMLLLAAVLAWQAMRARRARLPVPATPMRRRNEHG